MREDAAAKKPPSSNWTHTTHPAPRGMAVSRKQMVSRPYIKQAQIPGRDNSYSPRAFFHQACRYIFDSLGRPLSLERSTLPSLRLSSRPSRASSSLLACCHGWLRLIPSLPPVSQPISGRFAGHLWSWTWPNIQQCPLCCWESCLRICCQQYLSSWAGSLLESAEEWTRERSCFLGL